MSAVRSAKECRNDYAKKKEAVLKLLGAVKEFYRSEQDEERAEAFEALYEDLLHGEFSIVVVGEFSTGKSTLLNAMLRKRILPSFTDETTATINVLRHSEKAASGEAGIVYYSDGKQKKLDDASIETILKFASTKGDHVAQEVEHLELYLDSDFLKDGVTLVDSPGLNGVAEGHRKITGQQILKSHAGIFLFSGDHPGSKTDFEFLHELQKKVKTVFLVLNKIDMVKEDEGESVEDLVGSLKADYKKQFPDAKTLPEIWPVAAYPALVARSEEAVFDQAFGSLNDQKREELEKESRLSEFEDRLFHFLSHGEKSKQQLMSPVWHVLEAAGRSQEIFFEEKKALEGKIGSEELENEIQNIEEQLSFLGTRLKDGEMEIRQKLHIVFKEICEKLEAQIENLKKRKIDGMEEIDDLDELNMYFENFEESFLGGVRRFIQEGREDLSEKLMELARDWYLGYEGIFGQKIDKGEEMADVKLSGHMDLPGRYFKVGLEQMEEKTQELVEELKALEQQTEQAKMDFYKAKEAERERRRIEDEIKGLQEEKRRVEQIYIPPVERNQVQDYKEIRRKILFLTVARQEVPYTRIEADATEHDAAIKRQKDSMERLEEEIKIQKGQKEAYKGMDVELSRASYERSLEKEDAKRMDLIRQRDANREEIQQKYRKEIKKNKKLFRHFCDEAEEDLLWQAKKELQKSESEYMSTIMAIVEANIWKDAADKRKRIGSLKEQISQSEDDKKAKLRQLDAKIEELEKIFGKALDLSAQLEAMEVDVIRAETL